MTASADENTAVQMAEELYNDIVALANAHPDNPRLLHDKAHAALHLVSIYSGKQEFAQAAKIYAEMSN